MDSFTILFPISGVETNFFFPPLVAFVISFFTSMGGVTGAFLLLPFQMSVLGFTSPSVSATNFLYNIVGTPGGIVSYIREQRMVWPLAGLITIGTLPGVLIGYYVRVLYLPDPKLFKLFVGLVLLYIGLRLFKSTGKKKASPAAPGGPLLPDLCCWHYRRNLRDWRRRYNRPFLCQHAEYSRVYGSRPGNVRDFHDIGCRRVLLQHHPDQ
jgi:uncharacterized membrane protein YfcA